MTSPEKKQICEECYRSTRILYKNRDGFFTKKLKSINHLELGYSKIISNPLTIFLEYLYVLYKKIRSVYQSLVKWLFPRRKKIWREKADAYVTGRLVFASRKSPRLPIVNMKVELWGRTVWFQWRKLSEGYSGEDGVFNLPVETRLARSIVLFPKLHFEVYDIKEIQFDIEGRAKRKFEIFHKIQFPKSDLIGMGYTLREIQLDYWSYRKDAQTPRAVIVGPDGDQIQHNSQGRDDAFVQQILPIELTKLKHMEQIRLEPESIDHETIQADYPENLTVCIEKKLPGYTRSDEWFGIRMMNGMNKAAFMPDTEDPGHLLVKYFGICNYDHNGDYAFPDVIIKFKMTDSGYPSPVSIKTRGALNAINKDQWQEQVFTSKNGQEWDAVKRIARVNGAVSTEADEHFTGTHLNTEQYSIAAYRHFRKSPLAVLMLPHMKECALINHGADRIIIHGFLPSATALTETGLKDRCKDLLGMQDWKNWKPMEILSDKHHYAQAENLFWETTGIYVDEFIEANKEAIIENWHEVYLFSRDLVEHSVPVYLSDIDMEKQDEKMRMQMEERYEYYKFQYAFDDNLDREVFNGELKAVSPITTTPVYEASSNDLQNLKDACRYAIMMATFMHTWINEHQYDDLGEVMYNCGGLRFGTDEKGVLAPETDLSIAPDLTRSTQQLWFTNFLSRTEYGFITKNEDGDVNPRFTKLLEDRRADFERIGVDIDSIESRTNI